MDHPKTHRPCRRPTRWLLLVATLKAGAHLLTAARYPLHADELYYVVCGRHPAWAYPDHPPLTPWVAGAVDAAVGPEAFWLRLVPALIGVTIVLLTGWMACRFGAGRNGQLLASGAVLLSPLFLLSNSMLQTVSFDQLAWILVGAFWIRILAGESPRLFLAAGAAFALGALAKLTVLAWALGVFGGSLLTSARAQLRRPWPWAAATIALLAAVPVLHWQSVHGWPVLEFMRASRAEDPVTPWGFLGMQLLMAGPVVGSLLLVVGFAGLLRGQVLRPWRAIGVAILITWLVFLVTGGKPYYVGPTLPLLFAAGGAVLDGFLARRRRAWTVLILAVLASQSIIASAFLPVLPADRVLDRIDTLPHDDWQKMFGWSEVVAELAGAVAALTPSERVGLRILTDNYGLAAAVDVYGPARGLPAAISGHNGYAFWETDPPLDPLVVVGYSTEIFARHYDTVRPLGHVIGLEEFESQESGEPIFFCAGRRTDARELWHALIHFD